MKGPVLRTVTAVALLPPLLFLVYLGPWATAFLLAVVAIVGARELGSLYRKSGLSLPSGLVAISAILWIVLHGSRVAIEASLVLLAIIVTTILLILVRRDRTVLTSLPGVLFFAIYLGLLPAHLLDFYRLGGSADPNPWPVFFALALVWGSDTGAYGVGSLAGRHKLCPTISPKKTWEGACAGLLVPMLLGLLLGAWIPWVGPGSRIVGGGVVGLFAQVGDLGESWMKRMASEKESGTLLPGHGGILDRLDSLVLSIPALYYWLQLSVEGF